MNLFINRKTLISYTVDTVFDNNFNIYVQNGEVVVSAPWYLSKKQIHSAVLEKTNWILSKLNEYETHKKMEYTNIMLKGKKYKTNIYFQNISSPELNLYESTIEIILPMKYKNNNISNIINLITSKLYSSVAEKEIDTIMEKARLMLNLAPENFEIKPLKNTLATCRDNKTIIINPEIFKYQPEIIEYIIIHQFCHLKYKTHSKSFYNMLSQYVPNYEILASNIHSIQY